MFHSTEYILTLLGILGRGSRQENGDGWRLRRLGNVDQFVETRYTQGYVLGRHTSIMESVQGHLGGRLTKGLSGQGANHFTWMGDCGVELCLNFT